MLTGSFWLLAANDYEYTIVAYISDLNVIHLVIKKTDK